MPVLPAIKNASALVLETPILIEPESVWSTLCSMYDVLELVMLPPLLIVPDNCKFLNFLVDKPKSIDADVCG